MGNVHQVVGQHGRADENLEAFGALRQTSLHAAAAEQYGDAALDAGAEALRLFEGGSFLQGFMLCSFLAAALGNAGAGDAGLSPLSNIAGSHPRYMRPGMPLRPND